MTILFDLEGTLIPKGSVGKSVGAVLEFLDRLAEEHRLMVLTSKSERLAEQLLSDMGAGARFQRVVGRDTYPEATNKAEALAELIEDEKIDDGATLMIGDRAHDMEAARGNSVCAIGVAWGHGNVHELRASGADYIVDTIEELEKLIQFLGSDDQA